MSKEAATDHIAKRVAATRDAYAKRGQFYSTRFGWFSKVAYPEEYAEYLFKRVRNTLGSEAVQYGAKDTANWLLKKGIKKAGMLGLGAVGWGADLLMPSELGASTMYGSEFESAEDAREREETRAESAEWLATQPGYEPEGTPPAWADPEWSWQQRFGDRDLSPEGVEEARRAAARTALEGSE